MASIGEINNAPIKTENKENMELKKTPPVLILLPPKQAGVNLDADECSIDKDSRKGRFGWDVIGCEFIPFIYRNGDKYYAARIFETRLLKDNLQKFHPDIIACAKIRGYRMTQAEAALYNEINRIHSDYHFHNGEFTTSDLVVTADDAGEFLQFLHSCFCILQKNAVQGCGFISICGPSIVPYIVREGHKYVPVFFFEDDDGMLSHQAVPVTGWYLALLKFCCTLQSLKKELYDVDPCMMVDWQIVKKHLQEGVEYKDVFPNIPAPYKLGEQSPSIQSNSVSQSQQAVEWTTAEHFIRHNHTQIPRNIIISLPSNTNFAQPPPLLPVTGVILGEKGRELSRIPKNGIPFLPKSMTKRKRPTA